jgi:hypothetical protein
MTSYEIDCSVIFKDIRTEVQKVADINSCDNNSTQFIIDAAGMLIAFVNYDDGHCSMCPETQETVKVNAKEIECSHTEGQNMPEEHANDYANAVTIHHSLQEAPVHSTVLLPWTDEFSESINCEIQISNWEQQLKMCKIPSNHSIRVTNFDLY